MVYCDHARKTATGVPLSQQVGENADSAATRRQAAPGAESARVTDVLSGETVGMDVNDAVDASWVVSLRAEPSPRERRRRRERRCPSSERSTGFSPTPKCSTHSGASHHPTVSLMTHSDTRVLARQPDLLRVRCSGRSSRSAVAMRLLAITSACVLVGACGGGAGGNDAPAVTPPPAAAELTWDNGNWDQQEWK